MNEYLLAVFESEVIAVSADCNSIQLTRQRNTQQTPPDEIAIPGRGQHKLDKRSPTGTNDARERRTSKKALYVCVCGTVRHTTCNARPPRTLDCRTEPLTSFATNKIDAMDQQSATRPARRARCMQQTFTTIPPTTPFRTPTVRSFPDTAQTRAGRMRADQKS